MASHYAVQSSPNPPVVIAASSRPGLLLCASARPLNGEISAPLLSCAKTRLEDSECNCPRCANASSQRHPYSQYDQRLSLVGQRLPQPVPPRERSIRTRNHSPSGSGRGHRSSDPSSNSPSRRFRSKIKPQPGEKLSAPGGSLPNGTYLAANRGRSPTAAMPSTLAPPTQSAAAGLHAHSQYLSPHGPNLHHHPMAANVGKSPHFKSFRNGGHSPLPPEQSNMWQTHLLTEPNPLLASMSTLTLPLATPSHAGSPYGTEMGHLSTTTASLIAAANGSVGSSGSTTPLNGHHHHPHAHPQVLAGQHAGFHQQHHQQHHHLFHPSPTAITAALNQTPTPILNSEDTYICCAYTPRCFIIQKVRPSPTSTGTCSSLQSPQSEHSQSSPAQRSSPVAAASPPSTVSSCSTGTSSAEVVSVLEISSQTKQQQSQPQPKPDSAKTQVQVQAKSTSRPSPPLLVTPPKLSLNGVAPVDSDTGSNSNRTTAASYNHSTTTTTSDRPSLISASASSATSNQKRTENSLSIDENESGGTGHGADPLGRLVGRPEDESCSPAAAAKATGAGNCNCNSNLDLCHRVKCHRGGGDSAPAETQQQPKQQAAKSGGCGSNKTSPKKKNDRSKGKAAKAAATGSSPLSTPEKSGTEQRTRPTKTKGSTEESSNSSQQQPQKPLVNGSLPHSADRAKRSAPSSRKSHPDALSDSPVKLDKLFLPAFALAAANERITGSGGNNVGQKTTSSTCSESSSSSSSSGHTSTPPSTASSSPSSGSRSSTDLAKRRPLASTTTTTIDDSTAVESKQQQKGTSKATEKVDNRCNVLGKSGGSRCDNDYDDEDDSLLVVVKEAEQKTSSRGNQTKTATVSDDADANAYCKDTTDGDDPLRTSSLDSGTVTKKDKLQQSSKPKMETDIMENSAYSNGAEVSSLCLNTGMPLDGNHYDAGINCQMVAMNHDGQIMSPESMMAELSINAENGGGVIVGNNGDIDVHLLPPEERPVTPSPSNVQGLPPRELHAALRRQLEYYFSRENLAKDTYLLSQMDKDQYVSIEIVAQFNNIRGLTLDQNLVLEVLRSSSEVHVDESGLKVRPNSRRCVILLRDVPREVDQEQIKQMFEMEKCPVQLAKCESTGTDGFWYLYFSSDEDATSAIRYLKETLVNYPNTNIPIMARIKAGKQPASGGGQYRNNNAAPTSNVIRPLGIVTAPSPVGSTISNQSAAVSPVSSLSGSVHNPAVLMPNVTPPSSVMGNEPGTVGVAPYSAANVFSAYPTNVPMLANNSRVYTTAPFYAPSPMIQLPSSTAPCYDLSTVFVANGLAPHTYSSGVVTSLTAGVPQACLSVAPAGSAHQQQPSLQFIATSGSGGPALIATNPGNSSSSGGGRYGGSNSNYGNNYSHYSHHYNTYPKSHGGGGGHHRTMNNVSANSNSGGPPGKPYRNNKYANSGGGGYMSGQYHPQQQQHHPSHSVYHPAYPPSSAAYHPNSYVPNAVAPNAVHPAAAVILTESPVSGAGLVNNSNPSSISSSVVCPPPSATASSASTSTSASCSSTSAISICVTTASNKESSVTGQPLKPTLHFNKQQQQQQSSGVNHATSHVLNSSVALPQAQHSGTTSQPHYSTKSSHHHVNSHSQNIHHKSNVEPMSEAPVASKPAILASKTTNAATVVNSSNGHPMDADRSSHSNNYSHRSSNQSSSLRNGPRTFEREPREYREPRELRLPKTGGAAGGAAGSGSGSSGYRGKREYSNNYIPPSSLTGAGAAPVSEIDGNVIRKSERSGSGKFSRGGGGPSGANPSKPDRDRTGSGTFSRPGRNGPQNSASNAIAPPEQPFKLQDTAFPPLPGMTEGGGGSGDSKEAVESTAAIIHSSDAQSGSNMGANGAGGPGKSHESSLADVVKGHASVASLSLNGNTSSPVLEDRNANNNSENSSHQQTTPVESKPHQQQQQRKSNIKESKTVEEEEKLCNALSKSSGSRCDHGADDGLSVLPVPVKEEQLKIGNSSRGNQIKAAAAPLPDDAHASPDASHTTESDDLLRTNSLDSGVAKEDKHQQQAINKFDMDLTENSSYSSGADASSLSRSSDFPLDGLPGAPAFDVSSQSSTFTYAQIARLKANKLASQAAAAAASAVATANHDSGTASLASSPSDHTIAVNNVGVGASLVNHHIHKDQHSATSNASLRTRSIVK